MKPRSVRWARRIIHVAEMRSSQKVMILKPEGKTSLGRPRHRREY
jgi:hypothetical protein